MFLRILLSLLLAASAAASTLRASPPETAVLLKESRIEAGIVVLVGRSDGGLAAELAGGGRMLVDALDLEAAAVAEARRIIQARGLYGLATASQVSGFTRLPYADNLINLLVADLDELKDKAPPQTEILRVLLPKGVAYLRKDGRWTAAVKPRPAEMDDWTHFDHGADGNGVSHDKFVAPPTQLQWISTVQPIPPQGNPAGYSIATAYRAAGGRVFHGLYEELPAQAKAGRPPRQYFFVARDAFNGIPLWRLKTAAVRCLDWQTVASEDRLYTFTEPKGPAVAVDAASGQIATSFDQGSRLTNEQGMTRLRYAAGTLLETSGDTMYALDGRTGQRKWSYVEPESVLLFPSVDAAAGRVYAVAADPAVKHNFTRWPCAKTTALVCLDLAGGKLVWRSKETAGLSIGQILPCGGRLALFGSVGIGGGAKDDGLAASVDPATGKLVWKSQITGGGAYAKQVWGLNMLARDGQLFYATPWHLYKLDPATGRRSDHWLSGYNQRCNRLAATDDWFIMGLGSFIDRQAVAHIHGITRSGCSQGATPANGLCYYTPSQCGCITMLRGHVALSSEPLLPAMADSLRWATLRAPSAAEAPAASRRANVPTSTIAAEWVDPRAASRETAPVAVGDDRMVAVIHEHRLERRDAAGKPRWSFTADGRITAPPVVLEDQCFFGSHDGYVYCLALADGRPRWRFLAAPYHRKTMVRGQLESSWPVLGLALHEGKICASAGYHPELGGGIFVWGLEPASGQLAWKKALSLPQFVLANAERARVPVDQVLNGALESDGKELKLPGIAFRPEESDEEIRAKVVRAVKK
jgi:outer membrane protein assembly factor BamB